MKPERLLELKTKAEAAIEARQGRPIEAGRATVAFAPEVVLELCLELESYNDLITWVNRPDALAITTAQINARIDYEHEFRNALITLRAGYADAVMLVSENEPEFIARARVLLASVDSLLNGPPPALASESAHA